MGKKKKYRLKPKNWDETFRGKFKTEVPIKLVIVEANNPDEACRMKGWLPADTEVREVK